MLEANAVTIDTQLTVDDFRSMHGQSFPSLLEKTKEVYAFIYGIIDNVYTDFSGVATLWNGNGLERRTAVSKARLCYALLCAWYITDLYPNIAQGVQMSGGIPLVSKRIGNVTLTFDTSSNGAQGLQQLKSNAFGVKAYNMIRNSSKMSYIRS